jgi:hypothetical protein
VDESGSAKALDLLRHAVDRIRELAPSEYLGLPATELIAIKMMWQSVSKSEAIHSLLGDGFSDEASILLRSQMWDVQRLIYMDQNPDDRYALLFGVGNKQIHNLDSLASVAEEIGLDTTAIREAVSKQRQAFEEARAKRGVSRLRRFPEGLGIARNIGRLTDMLGHQMYSANAHSAAWSMLANVTILEDGKVNLSSRNEKSGYVIGIAQSSAEYLIEGATVTAQAHEWELLPELLEWRVEIDRRIKQLNRQ